MRNIAVVLLGLVFLVQGCSTEPYWPPYKSPQDECDHLCFFFLNNTSLDITPESGKGVAFCVDKNDTGDDFIYVAAYGLSPEERDTLKMELLDAANALLVSQGLNIVYFRRARAKVMSRNQIQFIFRKEDIIDSTGEIMTRGFGHYVTPTSKHVLNDSLKERSDSQLTIIRSVFRRPVEHVPGNWRKPLYE